MNNIGLIDIGANLTHPELYNQLDKIVENLQSANIKKVIITSSNLEDTKTALNIINLYPGLFYTTTGFHPHNAKDFSLDDVDKIHDYGEDKNIVAIGECGLDYYREYSTKEQQTYCFEEQLLIAESLELPVFLHERHAHKDFTKILKSHINKIKNSVVHCFTGTENELKTYLDMGCYIGITGWISDTSRGKHLHDLLKYIPEDRLMLETDAPYLIPHNIPFKHNGINEPSFLNFVAQTIAECLNKDINAVKEATYRNTKRFFLI
jgi:TatD DNase family protein